MPILVVISLVALSLLSPATLTTSNPSGSGPWPMSHQNAQHTGLSPFPGPAVPFLLWKFHTGGIVDSPPAIGRERIYLTSEDGNVYALNLHGILLWTFRTAWPLTSTPAIGADGTIYVAGCLQCEQSYPHNNGNPQGVLYALNPGGQLKWNLTLPNAGEGTDILAAPTIGPDGTIYTSNLDFQILAVNPNGVIKWERSTGGEVFNSPTVGHDGTLYVGIDDDNPFQASLCGHCLVALNPDGTLKWNTPFNVGQVNGPVGPDGTIYAANIAINPNGTIKWQVNDSILDDIGPNGTIYATSPDGGISAINPDGSLKWSISASTSGLAIGADGTIFFGQSPSSSGYIYAVSSGGTAVWKFPIGNTSWISSPSIGTDRTLYVGAADGNLYAIG